jgi:hypothetical protein
MRLEGITCTKCLTIWDKEMDTDSASSDAQEGILPLFRRT